MVSAQPSVNATSPLEARITGSLGHRYAQELFRNSGQFPIANLLLELLLEGPQIFLHPDPYALLAAALLQAWLIARWEHTRSPRPFIGNLVGPAAYTAVEFLFERSDDMIQRLAVLLLEPCCRNEEIPHTRGVFSLKKGKDPESPFFL